MIPNKTKQAYRGYLVGWNQFYNAYTIEKGGFFISRSEPSLEAAHRSVDQLVDPCDGSTNTTDKYYYYVTIIRDSRRGFLLGPYASHDEALASVDRGRALAEAHDSRAVFDAFGTARTAVSRQSVFGV